MATTKYIWDPVIDGYLMETDSGEATQAVYTAEPTHFGRVVSQRRSSTTNYLHQDALGSIRQLTGAAKTTTDAWVYDAWGNEKVHTGSTILPLRWIGEVGLYEDTEESLQYVRRRYYDPSLSRWICADPLRFKAGDVNWYRYVKNAVTRRIDPRGLFASLEDVISGVVDNLQSCYLSSIFGDPSCPYPDSGEACDMYLQLFRAIAIAYGGQTGNPFVSLPDCPCNLKSRKEPRVIVCDTGGLTTETIIWATVFQNPDSNKWDDPSAPICCHPGAATCIRDTTSSTRSELFSGCTTRQQCCYDSSGQLLKSREGAGTPDLCTSPTMHNKLDVCSFACCKAAGRLHEYTSRWKPNSCSKE